MKLKYTDYNHAYYLDGVRASGVSTFAKVPDSNYNLDRWNKRMVALGMAVDPALVHRAIAHHDDKSELDKVAEDALKSAKAHEKADRGTAIHRTLERHDLGEDIIDTPENRALRAAYDKALAGAGLEVVQEYVERIVVHPSIRLAGRFDRLLRRRRDGKFVIADVKSGTNAVKYPQSTSVQLAMYAYAPLLAGPIPREGGETEEFVKLPEKLDMKWGYIVHTPDEHTVQVVKINIAEGWKIAQASINPILEWRKRTDLIVPVGTTSIDELAEKASAERVSWIKGRLQLITMTEEPKRAKELVASLWPEGVAKPKQSNAWTEGDVDVLGEMLSRVENALATPFSERDPALKEMRSA